MVGRKIFLGGNGLGQSRNDIFNILVDMGNLHDGISENPNQFPVF